MDSTSSKKNDDVSNKISDFFKSVNSEKITNNDIRDDVIDSPSTTSAGFLSFLSNIPWFFWMILVLILAFLGFNVFIYLAKGTQDITNVFGPVSQWIFNLFGMTASQTAEVAGAGAAALATSGIELSTQGANALAEDGEIAQTNVLNNVLNKQLPEMAGSMPENSYQADDSTSLIQQNKSAGKSGWCYIGEDRGFRSCIKVGENDTCMSGDIFPSRDICVNPNLRP